MSNDLEHRLETIREMRALDETGQPKHTQVEVAEELDISQARVSQLERTHNLKPHQITYDENNQENQEVLDDNQEGMGIRSENEGSKEGATRRGKERMSDEGNNDDDNQSDDWVCTSCGNDEYYSASEYVSKYGDKLEETHRRTLHNASKVCANCGQVE